MKDGEELKQRVAPMTKLEALQLARDMLRNAHSPMEFVPKCPECDRIRELDALIMDEKARPEARLTEQEWKDCRDMFYGMADIHSDPGDRMFEILCKRLKVDKPSPQNGE